MKILSFGLDLVTAHYIEGNGHTLVDGSAENAEMFKQFVDYETPSAVTVNLNNHPWLYAGIADIRRKKVNVPIVAISDVVPGVCSSQRRAMFLESGGNDLIHKPIHDRELLASLRSIHYLHSGAQQQSAHEVCFRSAFVVLDSSIHQVTVNGKVLLLTAKEFQILEILMEHPGKVMKRHNIYETMYGCLEIPGSNSLEVIISRLRHKLFLANPDAAEAVETIRGVGYKMQTD